MHTIGQAAPEVDSLTTGTKGGGFGNWRKGEST